MDNSDKIKTKMGILANEMESLTSETTLMGWPEDIGELIENWRIAANQLPDEIEQKKRILFRLDMAQGSLSRNDVQAYKISLLCAKKYFQDAKHANYLLGISKQFQENGRRSGEERAEERRPIWKEWKDLADKIQKEAPQKLSTIELARRVKNRLNPPDCIQTIRKRIL